MASQVTCGLNVMAIYGSSLSEYDALNISIRNEGDDDIQSDVLYFTDGTALWFNRRSLWYDTTKPKLTDSDIYISDMRMVSGHH